MVFLSKNVIFLYILKVFFTMLQLKIFQEYRIILYIFGTSLCVTSPLSIGDVISAQVKNSGS